MPSEAIRCTDCGATFRGVPSWLATAKVKFTCTNCPKRPSRAIARFETPVAATAVVDADPEADLDAAEMDEVDEDADLDISAEDLEDDKDQKDL